MKARRDKNGQIIIGLPKYYKNYAGNFHKQSDDVHKEFGFYPIVEPNYDPKRQRLGELVFDDVKEQFVYELVDVNHNLDDIKERLRGELKLITQEVSDVIIRVKNIYDPLGINPENLPNEFKQKAQQIAPLRSTILRNIEDLSDIDEALDFIVRNDEVNTLIEDLQSFL